MGHWTRIWYPFCYLMRHFWGYLPRCCQIVSINKAKKSIWNGGTLKLQFKFHYQIPICYSEKFAAPWKTNLYFHFVNEIFRYQIEIWKSDFRGTGPLLLQLSWSNQISSENGEEGVLTSMNNWTRMINWNLEMHMNWEVLVCFNITGRGEVLIAKWKFRPQVQTYIFVL